MSRSSNGILTIVEVIPMGFLTFDWFGLIQKLFSFFSDERSSVGLAQTGIQAMARIIVWFFILRPLAALSYAIVSMFSCSFSLFG